MSDQVSAAQPPDGLATPSPANPRRPLLRRVLSGPAMGWFERYALVILLGVIVLFFAFYSKTADTFPTVDNLQVLIAGQAVLGLVALAALMPLSAGEWDLSVGASAGLSAVFVASSMSSGTPIILAILIGVGVGSIVGLVNALLITRVGTNAVIATLGISIIVTGVIQQKTGGVALVADIPKSFTSFGSDTWLGIPRLGVALLAITAVVYYLMYHTPAGRYLYAIGSNREASDLVGIRTKLYLGLAFIAAGALAGLAGVLNVAYSAGADPRVASTLLLPALAAAFLSASVIRPGQPNVVGTIVAVFFLATLNNGLTLAGVEPYVNDYVNGTALVVGVSLSVYLGRRRGRA